MSTEPAPHEPPVLTKLAWPDVARAAQQIGVAVIPVGSIEQHGPHLPLDVDIATAQHLALEGAREAGARLGRPAAVLAPALPFGGPELGMTEWPGTITLRPQVFVDVLLEVIAGLARAGFRAVAVVNGCYGNLAALARAAEQARAAHPQTEFVVIESVWRDREAVGAVRKSEPGGTGHACEIETSVALAIDPQHVQMERAVDELAALPAAARAFDFQAEDASAPQVPFGQLTRSGVIGRATLGTVEKGQAVLQAATARVAGVLVELAGRAQISPRP